MSEGNDNAENPMARPPLGLPVGSVRALITILVLTVAGVETMRGNKLPELWSETLLIAIAHYFMSRRHLHVSTAVLNRLESEGTVRVDRNPLFLPRYTMPILILGALGGLGYYMYSVQQIRKLSEVPVEYVGACSYVLGSVMRLLFSRDPRPGDTGKGIRLWADLNAVAVISIVAGISLFYFLDKRELLPDNVRDYALAIVLFYFGSR